MAQADLIVQTPRGSSIQKIEDQQISGVRQRECVLLHAQPLPRRGAAGGNGAWLPVPLFNQFPQSTRLRYGAI